VSIDGIIVLSSRVIIEYQSGSDIIDIDSTHICDL